MPSDRLRWSVDSRRGGDLLARGDSRVLGRCLSEPERGDFEPPTSKPGRLPFERDRSDLGEVGRGDLEPPSVDFGVASGFGDPGLLDPDSKGGKLPFE